MDLDLSKHCGHGVPLDRQCDACRHLYAGLDASAARVATARAEGFAAGIEAAAKVAEGFEVTDYGQHIASAIRSLASRPGEKP